MNDGELYRRLQCLQITVTLVPESALNSLKILARLVALIRSFKPDVLHTHRQKENILGNLANLLATFPFKKRAASVRTAHGAPEFLPKGKQKIQVWLDNMVGEYLQQAIISVSADLAAKLGHIFPTRKIHVIQNGVDSAALRADVTITEFRSTAPNKLHIGIIGRIESVKRIDIFIETAKQLTQSLSVTQSLNFYVIGDGSLRLEMEKKATELGLVSKINFLGHRNDIASCIHSLDAIVMCSDHEGTPMTALESLALGTPIIAHEVGGLAEVLKDYPKLLVANHSPEGYAEALLNLFSATNIEIALNPVYEATTNTESTLRLYKTLAA
jgi:glycosyltransferase involved in cell wall biosynthesis